MKSRTHTANAMYLIRFDISFEKLSRENYVIEGYFNPRDYFKARIQLEDSIMHSNKVFYKYIGDGYMAGQEVNFEIETSKSLERITEGYGYEEEIGMTPTDCQINLLYWPKGESELYSKENFFIYPKGNVIKRDYVSRNGYPELNLPYVLQRIQEQSLVNGTYNHVKGGTLKVVELNDDKLLVQFNFGLGFFQNILEKSGDSYIFKKTEFGSLCNFKLKYLDGIIRVETLNDGYGCGYGRGVQHDGLYQRINSHIPEF